MSEHRRTPEEIEDSIRSTQERIDARLAQIQNTLSPSGIIEGIFGGQNNPAGNGLSAPVRVIRENPIPAALIGTGLAWLMEGMVTGRNGAGTHRQNGVQSADPAARVGEHLSEIRDTVSESVDDVRSSVTSAAKTTRERAQKFSGEAAESAAAAKDAAGEFLSEAPGKTQEIGRGAIRWTKENPIPTALMCVAAGAAIASVFSLKRGGNGANGAQAQANPEKSSREPKRAAPKKKPSKQAAAKSAKTSRRKTSASKTAKAGPKAKTGARKNGRAKAPAGSNAASASA